MDLTYIDTVAQAIRENVPADLLPDEDGENLFRIYALLALSKGANTSPEDVHDAWSVWMTQRGESHKSVRPYRDLDRETQREDDPFVAAIHAAARNL